MVGIETILSIFSGTIGLVAGAVGSYFVMRKKQARITERRRAATYFDNKAEHLLTMYSEMRQCHHVLNKYANKVNNGGVTQQEFEQEVKPEVSAFNESLRQSRVYLTEDEYDRVESVFVPFADAEFFIYSHANGTSRRNMNWGTFGTSYNQTEKELRKIIQEIYMVEN